MRKTQKQGISTDAIVTPLDDGAIDRSKNPTVNKIFLTLQEASLLSGLSADYLTQMINAGNLRAIVDKEQKIRRSDLERL